MPNSTNAQIFEKISWLYDKLLHVDLDENFVESLGEFRRLTSKEETYNGQKYPAVYMWSDDYGGLTFNYGNGKKLQLILNLEFYYCYGFYIDGAVYGFKGEASEGLNKLGFEVTELSFGDAYYQIDALLTPGALQELKDTQVTLDAITNSLDCINDTSIEFSDKAKDILTAFWSLIEGIRFAYISQTVDGLIGGGSTARNYGDFFNLAEKWADLSVAAAEKGVLNPDIAVYELHRMRSIM